ncbi:MAG: M6 family metalloprotease domain-containing protein [Desulforudis sp.]|jgi:M6 family metalloprotease-like protein|nr:MAG: M6 family metalloprotease domain-containing protein [Desulforudis sp.]
MIPCCLSVANSIFLSIMNQLININIIITLITILLSISGSWLINSAKPAFALEPPGIGEIEKLKSTGELAQRIIKAEAIGNHKFDEYLLSKALVKAKQAYFRQQGVGQSEIDKLASLPAPPPAWGGMPATGNVKMFALLIDFNEYPHFNSQADIHNRLFGAGNPSDFPKESLTSYYLRSSYGLLTLSGSTLGWYRPPYNRSSIPQTEEGRQQLIREAVTYFNAQGHDFAQYDNDNDGFIDYFAVFWTGPNNGWANFWWGYEASWNDSSYVIDGKKMNHYSWQWESYWDVATNSGGPFDSATIIHETGHALGLPDYYDYTSTVGPKGGVGGLDMMCGVWGDHNSMSKWMLGWIDPAIVSSASRTLTLNPSGTDKDAVVVWPGISNDANDEFFVIQNRYRTANDFDFPGDGLLVWHVDARRDIYGSYIYNNSFTNHKLLRLMEADGLESIENYGGADAGDYYRSGKVFNACSSPSSVRYGGESSSVSVSNIVENGQQITASISAKDATVCTCTVTVLKSGDGVGAVYSSGIGHSDFPRSWTYGAGVQVVLTALALPGSDFLGWAGCDSVSGYQCFVNTSTNKTVSVSFSYSSLDGAIAGKVTRPDGITSILGAAVAAYRWDTSSSYWDFVDSVFADDDGTYFIGGLPADTYRIMFYDNNGEYVQEYYNNKQSIESADNIQVDAGKITGGMDASLSLGGRITGRLTGPDGTSPIKNSQVYSYVLNKSTSVWEYASLGVTDNDGSFIISGLLSGTYRVAFQDHSGLYLPEYYNNKSRFDLADNISVIAGQDTPGINATLMPGGSVSGTVTGPDGITPIGDVGIYAFIYNNSTASWDYAGSATSGQNGAYVIQGLPSGLCKIEFLDNSGFYQFEYYNNKPSSDSADLITVAAGLNTANINASLLLFGKSELSVSPASQYVARKPGSALFRVENLGSESMGWQAAIISGGDWLSITSGADGTDFGNITCTYTENRGSAARIGRIRITASGAAGSPMEVTLTQQGTTVLPIGALLLLLF